MRCMPFSRNCVCLSPPSVSVPLHPLVSVPLPPTCVLPVHIYISVNSILVITAPCVYICPPPSMCVRPSSVSVCPPWFHPPHVSMSVHTLPPMRVHPYVFVPPSLKYFLAGIFFAGNTDTAAFYIRCTKVMQVGRHNIYLGGNGHRFLTLWGGGGQTNISCWE